MSVAKAAKLERQTFETSRELEFFSEKELMMQIGYDQDQWPIALLKELIDNALDACEVAGIPPEIEVTIGEDSFSIKDNGPGLPEATMLKSMDYLVRVSDKAYYVSPTRGQMGNALKAVWAAGFVAHGNGTIEVVTGEKHYVITVSAYHRARYLQELQVQIEEWKEENKRDGVPKGLPKRVEKILVEQPNTSWDDAIWKCAGEDLKRAL